MVGVARIELATPAMSTQCSTTELHAHTFRGDAPLKGLHAGWQAPRATKCDYCWCDRSALSNNASTSRTRSLRWKGLDSSFACGTFSSARSDTAAKPVMNITRSEAHTSELQSLMRTSYAVFGLQKKKTTTHDT